MPVTKPAFYKVLDELFELDEGTVTGAERLDALGEWDSLRVVSLIALVDERFQIILPAEGFADAKTVQDLVAMFGKDLAE
jgi:acyl carrier protein